MSDENPHSGLVLKLWTKYVKEKLSALNSARLSGDIKTEMLKAATSSGGDKAAIKAVVPAYLMARGRNTETGAKIDGAAKPKKEKKTETAAPTTAVAEEPKKKKKKDGDVVADPAKDALIAAGAAKAIKGDDEAGIPAGNIDLRKLTRPTMKGMAIDLGVKYKKKWTDDQLRGKVARKMIGMDGVAVAAIAAADPAKVEGMTDCVGVLLDLTKAICITCPAQEDCRKLFEQHRQTGFKIFDQLRAGDKASFGSTNGAQVEAKVTGPKLVAKQADLPLQPTKMEVQDVGKVSKLAPVKVDGKDVNNEDHKSFLIAVKKGKPADLAAFQKLVGAEYETADLAGLTQWFVKYCVALGLIKLV